MTLRLRTQPSFLPSSKAKSNNLPKNQQEPHLKSRHLKALEGEKMPSKSKAIAKVARTGSNVSFNSGMVTKKISLSCATKTQTSVRGTIAEMIEVLAEEVATTREPI